MNPNQYSSYYNQPYGNHPSNISGSNNKQYSQPSTVPTMTTTTNNAATTTGNDFISTTYESTSLGNQQQTLSNTLLDQIFRGVSEIAIHQRLEPLEYLIGIETNNMYDFQLNNSTMGTAIEYSGSLERAYIGNKRPFDMYVYVNRQHVLTFERPFQFIGGSIRVFDPQGNRLVGVIKKKFDVTHRKFKIEDGAGRKLFTAKATKFLWMKKKYKLVTRTYPKHEIGGISKKFTGLLQTFYTDADKFVTVFPESLTSDEKALLLATVILIDFSYHEKSHSP
ncbi:hypothetical protein ABK040_016263 [Willaertia magna]